MIFHTQAMFSNDKSIRKKQYALQLKSPTVPPPHEDLQTWGTNVHSEKSIHKSCFSQVKVTKTKIHNGGKMSL